MNALAYGVPDISFRSKRVTKYNQYDIIGSGRSGITKHYASLLVERDSAFYGRYSHTNRYVTYYTNGDKTCSVGAICRRKAQITWKCGANHMKVIRIGRSDSFHSNFEIEFNPKFNPGIPGTCIRTSNMTYFSQTF